MRRQRALKWVLDAPHTTETAGPWRWEPTSRAAPGPPGTQRTSHTCNLSQGTGNVEVHDTRPAEVSAEARPSFSFCCVSLGQAPNPTPTRAWNSLRQRQNPENRLASHRAIDVAALAILGCTETVGAPQRQIQTNRRGMATKSRKLPCPERLNVYRQRGTQRCYPIRENPSRAAAMPLMLSELHLGAMASQGERTAAERESGPVAISERRSDPPQRPGGLPREPREGCLVAAWG